jgi:hypothetical protein
MNAIRIRKRIDSETLHLPELNPLLGKTVEVIVLDETSAPQSPLRDPGCFASLPARKPPTPEELDALRPYLTKEQFEALAALASEDSLDVNAILELRAASMI